MNIRDLEYYIAVVRQKNFTRVAAQFQVQQPTITYAIKRLEAELETTLIYRDRSHKELIVTPTGKQFLIHAQSIVQELQVAKTEIEHIQNPKLHLGLPPIIGNYYFPKLSGIFFQEKLMSTIEVVDGGSRDLYSLLHQGKLDLVLLGSTQPVTDSLLEGTLLADKKFKIVVSPEHPLAKKKSVAFKDLASEKFVLLNEHYVHPNAFIKLTKQTHTTPDIIYRSNDLAILKSMIRENVGIGFLTEIAIFPEDHLVALPLTDAGQPHFLISLVSRSQQLASPMQKRVQQLIYEYFN